MSKPDWLVKLNMAAARASSAATPKDFRQVKQGLLISRRLMWIRHNPILLASWNDPERTQLLVLDGTNRWRGTLVLLRGQAAVEVTTTPDVLRRVYQPHRNVRWWLDQQLHRCDRLPKTA